MASSLYRLLGRRLGNGYTTARCQHLFRDFVDATAQVILTTDTIQVHFQRRAHNPLLLAAHYQDTDVPSRGWMVNAFTSASADSRCVVSSRNSQ